MSTVLAIGLDPGRSTGLSAVRWGSDGPELAAAFPIYGAGYSTWWKRATHAVSGMNRAIGEHTLDSPAVAYVEAIPATFRRLSMPGVSKGHKAWAGLGEARGLGVAALLAGGIRVESIDQKLWVSTLGSVAQAKNDNDPLLRVREASHLVRGARQALAEVADGSKAAQSRSVDVAESILIALAGCMLLRRQLRRTR